MPYVKRNSKGVIVDAQDSPMAGGTEWLSIDNTELSAYLEQNKTTELAMRNLASSDLDLVRVIEDLIELLMSKNIFIFSELPVSVQQKIGARKQLREEVHALSNLLGDDDGIF